jgi:hypothetical protein
MFYSQYGQDKYLETNIFKGYKNGFYVDVGAHDGIIINNTLYFEIKNRFIQILVLAHQRHEFHNFDKADVWTASS